MQREGTAASSGGLDSRLTSEFLDGGEEYVEGFDEEEILYDKNAIPVNPDIDPNVPSKDAFVAPYVETLAVTKYCDDLQMDAVKLLVTKSREASLVALPRLLQRFVKLGHGQKELDATVRYVRDVAPILVHVKLDQDGRLQKMVNDTHYRSQFETKCSNGSYDDRHGARIGWESRLFNKIYDNCKPFQRPKYGVLNIVNDPKGIQPAYGYGDSYFVLKGVRLRASFADQDTGNASAQLASCEYYNHVLVKYNEAELRAIIEVATGKAPFKDSGCIANYKEIQIHGDVRFNANIERVVVNDRHKGDTKICRLLEEFAEKNDCSYCFMSDAAAVGVTEHAAED